mmetsp:Transcript_65020/g.128562  ORF Transcript_65020/g.128562 Transcript_65020/m.128562 type:complete len:362 (-) Transcript_65020:172-1257(-)|eukprot:CAMPEP_0174703146 /NCGR_PEP_ID=MMETSP1094-20130205/7199_1 /TAXON_ID=156173 /ORGANISM="Chrysochromulina brevifilum, Strain UTEX LB 985" /LENGTH=361 /DNA_ID=CAMNT_0015901027 /DNA_START=82 /DNA_END=1167 /DNA_ORIENTATION=-
MPSSGAALLQGAALLLAQRVVNGRREWLFASSPLQVTEALLSKQHQSDVVCIEITGEARTPLASPPTELVQPPPPLPKAQLPLSLGSHYNMSLHAPNVWEVEVPDDVIEEARCIFESEGGPRDAFWKLRRSNDSHARVGVAGAPSFFALRSAGNDGLGGMGGRSSDITWISVDDKATYNIFKRLFCRLDLEKTFGSVVDLSEGLRLYSAFYVVRSYCTQPHFHVDYSRDVGVNGLTLMTPLASFINTQSFQLLYGRMPKGACKPQGEPARYVYQKGVGITFGSAFRHSTEPGTAHERNGLHAYLCFTFGTDRAEHWQKIYRNLGGNQSRVIARGMDGVLVLTRLGRQLQEAEAQEARPTRT